jgi:hypothetical protein
MYRIFTEQLKAFSTQKPKEPMCWLEKQGLKYKVICDNYVPPKPIFVNPILAPKIIPVFPLAIIPKQAHAFGLWNP